MGVGGRGRRHGVHGVHGGGHVIAGDVVFHFVHAVHGRHRLDVAWSRLRVSVHEHLCRLDVHAQNTFFAVGHGLKGRQLGGDSPSRLPLLLGGGYVRQGVQVRSGDLLRAGAERRTEVRATVGRDGVGNDGGGRGGVKAG